LANSINTIQSIELENFKGYRKSGDGVTKTIDMTVDGKPADLVLVTGKNGVGKTSLLEAMDWVLNQADVGAGGFLTTDKSQGAVSVNGRRLELQGKTKTDHRKLTTVASFFYQENIAELACNEIIQLLEPENKPGEEIKRGLKSLQIRLESWQRQLNSLKYRKNYEEERKLLAGRVNELVARIPQEFSLRKELVDSTLTLKNGNLQNQWESQIRNLSNSIGGISNLSEPVGSQLPDQLNHIGHSLLEYRGKLVDISDKESEPTAFTNAFLSTIQSLPTDLPIKRWSAGTALVPSDLENTLFVGFDGEIYRDAVDELEKKRSELTSDYQRLTNLQGQLKGDGRSLLGWVNDFSENVNNWLKVWDAHPDSKRVSELKQGLQDQLEGLSDLANVRYAEINDQIERVTRDGQAVTDKLNQMRRSQGVAKDINAHSKQLSHLIDRPAFTVEGLTDYVSDYLEKLKTPETTGFSASKGEAVIQELGKVFSDWSALEIQKAEDEANSTDLVSLEQAEKMISDALAICKQESSARSQLLSVVGVIPQVELEQLLSNMNLLLASFHFPEDFLPIVLEKNGTDKSPKWSFTTKSGVKFDDLSTGQKSQLAICWTINLNLAMTKQLGHQVIGFDDFTTSLDMNQLIPAAVLLRKLAYADANDGWKRQVFVTSHHEDLTNRLLDFLLPPQGKLMKVIQFEDWSPESGPQLKCYKVDMGEVKSSGLEDAIKRVVTSC
jgi:energy-coupling factor transporter ATP-binding protein EcfA2